MAGATLSNILSYVQDSVQRTDIDEVIIEEINNAVLDVTMIAKPTEMEKTQTVSSITAGDEDHTLDSDVLAIEQVLMTNPDGETKPYLLERSRRSEWLLRDRTTTASEYGSPQYWYRRGNTLYIWPKPNTNNGNNWNMEISYIKRPATLASSSPSTAMDLNSEWNTVVKYRASALVWLRLVAPELYGFYMGAANEVFGSRNTVLGFEQQADQDSTFEFANNE